MNRSEEKKLRRIISEAARNAFSAKKSSSRRRLFEEDEKDDSKTSSKLDVSKGPSAAIAFLNGPGADKRVRALLNAGQRDGIPEDEKAKVAETSKTLGDLQPTQIEIELTKSIAFPLSKFDSLKKMISGGVQRVGPKGNDMIVTSGNLIIDGHHRWSSLFSVGGPDAQIAAIDVVLPEKDAPSVLAIVQTAIASTLTSGEPVPKAKAGGMNILGKGKDELVKMITSAWKSGGGEAGAILTDDFVKQCLDDPQVSKHFGLNTTAPGGTAKKEPESDQKAESRSRAESLLEKSSKFGTKMDKRITIARSTIINKVADNLSKMAAPAEGSPPRVDMPQLDQASGGVQGALANLQKGKVNYKTPFKIVDKGGGEREINVPAESSVKSGDVILERWQKLAGLIK